MGNYSGILSYIIESVNSFPNYYIKIACHGSEKPTGSNVTEGHQLMIISEANSCANDSTSQENNQPKNLCYIYRHIRLDTNMPFYIGKGTNTSGNYARSFKKRYRNQHWHNVVNKHGFKIEIVIENVTEEEANEKEVELILYYGRRDLGIDTLVNMTNGGEGVCGRSVSKETRKKISDSNKGRVLSEETRKKMCGKIHTEEHRRKNGDGNRGKKTH